MSINSKYALLSASALLVLSACEIRDADEASDATAEDAASDEAMVDEPLADEIDPEALPPDYPPLPSIDPADPPTEGDGEESAPEDLSGSEDGSPRYHTDPSTEPPGG